MKQEQRTRLVRRQNMVQRLSLSSSAPDSPFLADNTPFFDRCESELITLYMGGRMGILDLFNWRVTDTFKQTLKFLTYARPAYSEGGPTAGHLSDPCADPNGYEFGAAEITLTDFGRYGRKGPVRDAFKPERFCETDPRYFLDGSPLTNEFDWDLTFALDVLRQDLFRDAIIGDATTSGKFDGLQQWINTGYDSAILDSTVIDWAGNDLDGSGGGTKTINGSNYTGGADIVDILLALYRRFKQRIQWSPSLAGQPIPDDGIVLVLPTFLADCLLDKYTCWSVCEGRQYNEANLQTFEARQFRDSLVGGLYGAGSITLDGDRVHLFPWDWETIHGTHRGDMYFLTRQVGSTQLWEGQHLDGDMARAKMAELGQGQYFSTDGGRVFGVTTNDNLCIETKAWMRPRLWSRAPWLQARIMNVECDPILDPLSPDPLATSFYPVTSFGADAQTTG